MLESHEILPRSARPPDTRPRPESNLRFLWPKTPSSPRFPSNDPSRYARPVAFAHCTPDDVWADATQAGVRSLHDSFSNRTLPVEHRAEDTYNIARSQYPDGLILIPIGSDPTAIPAVLPAITSAGSSQGVTLQIANLLDYGVGVVVTFV